MLARKDPRDAVVYIDSNATVTDSLGCPSDHSPENHIVVEAHIFFNAFRSFDAILWGPDS
eukprot:5711808-Amphidinium_carterae.1